MPSTVYRGDLSEVTFGQESGIRLEHDYGGSGFTFTASFETGANAANAPHKNTEKDTSVIVLSGGAANTPVVSNVLQAPRGMLVGSKVIFSIKSSSPNWSTDDDYAVTGRSYTIIKQEVCDDANNDNDGKTEITVSPALKTDHSTVDKASKANDIMFILPFATPSLDVSMTNDDDADSALERVMTDQFVGLVSTVAFPETKVDLKRYHVVGLGRDVAVQMPGRFLNTDGTFECNIHNGRWFKYCLGQEVVKLTASSTGNTGGQTYSLNGATKPGASYLTFDGHADTPAINSVNWGVGDYIILNSSSAAVDVQTYNATAIGGGDVADAWGSTNITAANVFDRALKTEIRRVVGYTKNSADHYVWLDSPLTYGHADNLQVKFLKYQTDTALDSGNMFGSPHRTPASGNLTNPVEHLFFSRATVPSFSMEVSVRRTDADGVTNDVVDGSATDTKQLTRVFRGCKVKDWSLTTDTDAALRMNVNFDAALCYTDTGRLETQANGFTADQESNRGDRYDAHRLFEDTANTELKRKQSGIEKGTQKPFMFYNGSVTMLGTQLGQVVSFTLNGKTGVEQYYSINGANIADNVADQVPFAGTRNPVIAAEGKTEYDLEMEIIVDDPLFYHNMRRAVANFDETTSDNTDADQIRLSFVKQGTGATRESLDILMDDYFITEAPLPIPEDKGPMRAKLKVMPKSVKVIAKDTVLAA
tara:strand:+ start:315 stop:2426 length:2112 start_codon:yes stop_codon:yes gene_type:complete